MKQKSKSSWHLVLILCTAILLVAFNGLSVSAALPDFTMDFNSAISENASSFHSQGVSLMNQSNLAKFEIVNGVFGKADGDKSLYLHNTEGTLTSTSTDPYVQLELEKVVEGQNFRIAHGESMTIEFKLAFSEAATFFQLRGHAYSEATSAEGKINMPIIEVNPANKTLRFMEEPIVTLSDNEAEQGVWHTVQVQIFSGDGTAENPKTYSLTYDNRTMAEKQPFVLRTRTSGNNYAIRTDFYGLKLLWIEHYFGNAQTQDKTYTAGGFYIDDLHIHSGDYPKLQAPEIGVKTPGTASVIEDRHEIAINKTNLTKAMLEDILTLNCDRWEVYTDEKMVTPLADDDKISTGNMLVTVRDGIYRYDTFKVGVEIGEPTIWVNGAVDDKYAIGNLRVQIPLNTFEETVPVTFLAGQYDTETGRLIQIAKSDTSITGNGTAELTMEVTRQAGTQIKLFLWRENSMVPLCPVRTLEPYSESQIETVSPVYPGYVSRAVTLSYDDGQKQDQKLAELFEKYGFTATFNIVPEWVGDSNHLTVEQMKEIYQKHEVANHTYSHKALYLMEGQTDYDSKGNPLYGVSLSDAIDDINNGKEWLESNLGTTVKGLVWPNKHPSRDTRTDFDQLMAAVGENHSYTRWDDETGTFDLPDNWLQWQPTCHHSNMQQYTKEFLDLENGGEMKLYFIWGHSYEFDNDGATVTWEVLEDQLAQLASEDIWKASNGQVYDYVSAVRQLNQKGNMLSNPSDQTIYLYINGQKKEIQSGDSYRYGDPTKTETIACWGDSLTYGQGSFVDSSYPDVLAKLTGKAVYNMGVAGETSMTIAARQGAVDMVVPQDFIIPASGSVALPLASTTIEGNTYYYIPTAEDGKVAPMDVNYGGWTPTTINGVEGRLSISITDGDLRPRLLTSATFTRTKSGSEVYVPAGTKIHCAAHNVTGDVNIFFTGTNGGWNTNNTRATDSALEAKDLVELIQKQITATGSPEKYVVIGLTNGNYDSWKNTNGTLAEAFGENFLDAKAYMTSEQALEDAGITPTQQDITDLANGMIPTSLRSDSTHFNDAGYALLAQQVYVKLQELGYL